MLECSVEHLPTFILVAGRHDDHVGNAAQIAQIETAGMCRAIRSDQSGTVDGEHHRQVLQRDVVNELVVSTLQKG